MKAALLLAFGIAVEAAKPKVFGVGLSRTGTSSLGTRLLRRLSLKLRALSGEALVTLGYLNVHNDRCPTPHKARFQCCFNID